MTREHDFIDATPKALGDLPRQDQFKSDLAAQVDRQISLVFIDLDHFKSVNDKEGHDAGDTCLAVVVKSIYGPIAGKGRLYRYGGDEFAVILQNAHVEEAAGTAERIRRSIQESKPGGSIEVTASVGVAASDQDGLRDATALLRAADQAMYKIEEQRQEPGYRPFSQRSRAHLFRDRQVRGGVRRRCRDRNRCLGLLPIGAQRR